MVEISPKIFQKFRKLLKSRNATHSTQTSRNSSSKVEWKESVRENFSKIWVYLTRLSPFWKFLKILFHSLLEVAKNSKRKFWLNGKRPFFPGRNVPNGVPFLKSHLWYHFQAFAAVFRRWNWFLQFVLFLNEIKQSWILLTICPNQTFLQDFYSAIRVLEIHSRCFLHEATLLNFFSDENKLLLLRVGEVKTYRLLYVFWV